MLDSVASVPLRILFPGAIEGVERDPDAAVADRVDVDLEFPAVELEHQPLELFDGHRGLADLRGIVGVGLEHRRRVGLDHPVDVGLDRPRTDVPARIATAQAFVALEVVCREIGGHPKSGDRSKGEEALAVELLVEAELLLVSGRVLNSGEAETTCLGESPQERTALVVAGDLGNPGADQAHRPAFLQKAARLPGLVMDDFPELGLRRRRGDARELESIAVRPGGMSVIGDEEHGLVPGNGVEVGAVRKPSGDGRVAPTAPDHPGFVGPRSNPIGEPLLDLRKVGAGDVELVEGEASAEEVHVAVDETGEDQLSPEREDPGPGTDQGADFFGRSHAHDALSAHRDRLGEFARLFHRRHLAVDEDQVGRKLEGVLARSVEREKEREKAKHRSSLSVNQ